MYGITEVAAHDAAQVVDVLLEERVVEARRLAGPLDLGLRGPPAERRGDRVARRHPQQDEQDGEDDEEEQGRERQPDQQVAAEATTAGTG